MKLAMGLYSVLVLTRGAGDQGYIALGCTPHWCSLGEPGNEPRPGLYSALVLTRGVCERGLLRDCTPYWCSPGKPGNEASTGHLLCTGAHQGRQGTRLAMNLHSILVLTRRDGN